MVVLLVCIIICIRGQKKAQNSTVFRPFIRSGKNLRHFEIFYTTQMAQTNY